MPTMSRMAMLVVENSDWQLGARSNGSHDALDPGRNQLLEDNQA